jgi:hypothetical protein
MTHFPRGRALKRTRGVIEQAAALVPCHPAMIAAFVEVEAAGDGFWRDGRPKNLPEPHWLYRLLPASKKQDALRRGLAIKKWSRNTYKRLFPTPNTADKRYAFLDRVADLYGTEIAADMSSFGAGQTMGFNAEKCGYDNAYAMFEEFADNEDSHIFAIVKYLLRSGGRDELQSENCYGLARIYNGSGQVNIYGPRLEQALVRAKRRKWSSVPSQVVNMPKKQRNWLAIGDRSNDVREVQRMLNALGYHLVVDGDFGEATRRQVRAFQHDRGLKVDGYVGEDTMAELVRARTVPKVALVDGDMMPGDGREEDTGDDLLRKGSSTVRRARFGKMSDVITTGAAGTVGIGTILEAGETAKDNADRAKGLLETFLPSGWGMVIVGVCAAIVILSIIGWVRNNRIERTRVEEHRSGKVLTVGEPEY